jgi:pimeloyl-ACP methyl ester carboxylesterase
VFDRGTGPPLVVIPGVQGRWEWTRPALEHLARRCRTISYSLGGDFGSRRRPERGAGLEGYVRQLEEVLDEARLERAALCGVSFGGYIAVRFAARRPERVTALVLASAPGPGWKPNAQQSKWIAHPWISAPVFVATAPLRLMPEIRAAIPRRGMRTAFLLAQAVRCAAAPIIPSLMAARIRDVAEMDVREESAKVRAATLVISGEDGLDRVVPAASTRAFAAAIPGAEYRILPGTGHMGLLTRPERFAEIVTGFVHAHHH